MMLIVPSRVSLLRALCMPGAPEGIPNELLDRHGCGRKRCKLAQAVVKRTCTARTDGGHALLAS